MKMDYLLIYNNINFGIGTDKVYNILLQNVKLIILIDLTVICFALNLLLHVILNRKYSKIKSNHQLKFLFCYCLNKYFIIIRINK